MDLADGWRRKGYLDTSVSAMEHGCHDLTETRPVKKHILLGQQVASYVRKHYNRVC